MILTYHRGGHADGVTWELPVGLVRYWFRGTAYVVTRRSPARQEARASAPHSRRMAPQRPDHPESRAEAA